jgi:hypothetical protein
MVGDTVLASPWTASPMARSAQLVGAAAAAAAFHNDVIAATLAGAAAGLAINRHPDRGGGGPVLPTANR